MLKSYSKVDCGYLFTFIVGAVLPDVPSEYKYDYIVQYFKEATHVFPTISCDICTKMCYPHQVSTVAADINNSQYLPEELIRTLTLCNRCKTHVQSNKKTCPPKAYWNNLDPGVIPEELQVLSQVEQRLISRIIPFTKIVKLSGMYGQYSIQGQAVLFAQDIFEVVEKLPNMLPRSSSESGLVIVKESLENKNIVKEFTISRQSVLGALRWLIQNNPLYQDVTVQHDVRLEESDLFREIECDPLLANKESDTVINELETHFTSIGQYSRILRASWHQADHVSL